VTSPRPLAALVTDALPTVLVVDADDRARARIVEFLEDGFDVLEAADHHRAVEMARSWPVDVIVADAASGGRALLAAMTADVRLGALPVILISDGSSAADLGAHGFVPKNQGPDALVGPIRSAVRLHRWVRRHRDVIDGVPIGIVSLGLDGTVLEANRMAAEVLETTSEDLVGAPVETLAIGADWATIARRVYDSGRASLEWPRERADGQIADLRVELRPAHGRDGRMSRIDGIVEDISERKARERVIAHTNDQLAALYEVGTKITGTLRLRPVLQTIAHESVRLVDAGWTRITLAAAGRVETSLVAGDAGEPAASHFVGITGWVFEWLRC
jgi:PAS domain S-box-containing protein